MIIEIKGLIKHYKGKYAVNDLDLSVNENAIYGLLGCNGAGKTTTLSIISGLIRKDSGMVKVFGKDVDTSINEIKKHLGIMPQNMELFQNKTAYQNMVYYSKLKGVTDYKEINSYFKQFNIVKNVKAREMSHGQAKMVLILQAFIGKPKLVILDEPISGFDPKRIVELRKFIQKKSKECTILISSHNLDEINRLCSHVGIIHEGKMKIEGPKNKIKKGKTLEKAFIDII